MIHKNRKLFYVATGLVHSGAKAYDHDDAEVLALVNQIMKLNIPKNISEWFLRARTGQVEVNPYWPRGSAAAMACFFANDGYFDIDTCLSFFDSTGAMIDPIDSEDFRLWISDLPKVISYFEETELMQALWEKYCRIVDSRASKWDKSIKQAIKAATDFFGENLPEMSFSPNLFAAYNTDFVRIRSRITTIASEPDVESILHETLHIAVAVHRDKIIEFAKRNGLNDFANQDKMIELGYMVDDTAVSISHAIEECFVRAMSVVLANKNDERLQAHAKYGFNSVPFIAIHFKEILPTADKLESFINAVFIRILNDKQ